MPDLTPVATQIQPPNPMTGINTYSGILGLEQQAQTLQATRIANQTALANSQQAQQRNKELQAAQELVINGAKSGQYDDGQGGLDRQRLADDITKVAPTYGQQISNSLLSQANEIVANKQAHQNLSRSQQQQLGAGWGAVATKPNLTPTDFIDEANRQLDLNKDPEFRRMALSMLTHVPTKQPNESDAGYSSRLQGIARRWSIAATSPETAESQSAPNVQTIQGVGAPGQPGAGKPGLVPMNVNPQAPGGIQQAGGVIPQSVAPGGDIQEDAFHNKFRYDPQTNQVVPIGGGAGTPQNAGPGVPQIVGPGAQQPNSSPARNSVGGFAQPVPDQPRVLSDIDNVRRVGAQVGTNRYINSELLRLSSNTSTGPGTEEWHNALGAIGAPFGASLNSDYQLIGAYLDRQAAQNSEAMGLPNTNAGLATSQSLSGNTNYTPKALQSKVRLNDALNTAVDQYRKGLDLAVGTGNRPNLGAYQAFRSAWSTNFDPRVFAMENAIRSGDTAEQKRILQGLSPAERNELARKRAALTSLSDGQLPQ